MANKTSETNFSLRDLKEQFGEMKKTIDSAKKEYEEKGIKEENNGKQSFGQKILGIVVLVFLVGLGIFVLISNLGTVLLPKGSVTVVIKDQDNNKISGIKISITGEDGYYQEYEDAGNITILKLKEGKYTLLFDYVPEDYSCPELIENFELSKGKKMKLEYECTKIN